MDTRKPFPKTTLRSHRNSGRLIAKARQDDDGTFTVTYLDHIDGEPDEESGVPAGDVRKPVNSWDLANNDWLLTPSYGSATLIKIIAKKSALGRKAYADLSRYADDVAEYVTQGGGPTFGAHLRFRTWDDTVRWTAAKGIAPNGWSVDRFGAWVPVGDRRATTASALTPCTALGCSRPAAVDETGLCKMHNTHKIKSDERKAEWDARCEARREDDNRRAALRRSSEEWAQRLADEFGIAAEAADGGKVAVSGEGLYGLLSAISVELSEMGVPLADLIPPELRVRISDED
jgi:hypothetical protein